MTKLRTLERRSFLKFAAGLPFLAAMSRPAVAQTKEPVRFLLDWTWWPPQIPLLVAQEKGFFTKAGLDVEMRQGTGSGSTCQVVGTGAYDIGNVNLTTAAQAIGKGVTIKSVATFGNKGASSLSFKSGTIKTIKDLVGKRIGSTPGGSDAQILPAFFAKNGIDVSQVRIVNLPGDAKLGALLSGQIDALSGDGYYYVALAADKGVRLEEFVFGDYQANTIGYGLIASHAYIKSQPDRIKRFVAAVLEGYRYADANLDESIGIYKKVSKADQDDTSVRNIITGYLSLIKSGEQAGKSFSGRNEAEVWRGTLDILSRYGGLSSTKDQLEYWTNQFVDS